jgi:hypothetical protein
MLVSMLLWWVVENSPNSVQPNLYKVEFCITIL